MPFADRSPRLLVGFTVVIAHALAIFAAILMAPPARSVISDRPVTVRFVSSGPETRRQWRPPEPVAVVLAVNTPAPILPPVERDDPPPPRAISAPQRSAAAAAPTEDRSAPKLVSVVEYVREPAPRYPPQSRRLREQGVVVLRVLIDERGQACDIEIETSSGYARLDRAARDAVAAAAFRPYMEDGAPRRALVLIPIEFFLDRGTA